MQPTRLASAAEQSTSKGAVIHSRLVTAPSFEVSERLKRPAGSRVLTVGQLATKTDEREEKGNNGADVDNVAAAVEVRPIKLSYGGQLSTRFVDMRLERQLCCYNSHVRSYWGLGNLGLRKVGEEAINTLRRWSAAATRHHELVVGESSALTAQGAEWPSCSRRDGTSRPVPPRGRLQGREKREIPEKTANQRHHPARFPIAKFRSYPTRIELSSPWWEASNLNPFCAVLAESLDRQPPTKSIRITIPDNPRFKYVKNVEDDVVDFLRASYCICISPLLQLTIPFLSSLCEQFKVKISHTLNDNAKSVAVTEQKADKARANKFYRDHAL
ncbi:hypothetical protein PR048_005559 [Dryococelus australis]|uniref:Uncharacterized protein n=1 Tax=Dryococelus australis TaxID=614101 RepID=A0ABQ9I8I2_9NEOP|nr:hypothetical protein PR048_005559 [Dryococelus australis]